MTYSWSPAVKEPLESDIFAEKIADYFNNWVVSGLAATGDATTTLTIASGTCYISGWRVETDGETYATGAIGNGTYYLYLELTRTGTKLTSIDEAHYGSIQAETDKMVICRFDTTGGTGTLDNIVDLHRLPVDASMALLFMDTTTGVVTSLADWQHATDTAKIDGGEIYAGSVDETQIAAGAITNTEVDVSAAIAWSKITPSTNLTYDNVAEAIGSAWTFNNNIIAATSQTYGIRIQYTTTETGRIYAPSATAVRYSASDDMDVALYVGGTGDAYVTAVGGDIYLAPSGKIYLQDDIVVGGQYIRSGAGTMSMTSDTEDYLFIDIECEASTTSGGIESSVSGVSGGTEAGRVGEHTSKAFREIAGRNVWDYDGTLGDYSMRDDLGDLRKIKPLDVLIDGKKIKGSWGDGFWDAATIPKYLKSKQQYEANAGTANEGRAYIKSGSFKGWTISLLQKLDEADLSQDQEREDLKALMILFDARLTAIGA